VENQFSAAPSALGYLYQCRVALALLLQRGRTEPTCALSLETLDDVSFEKQGSASELLQTKHHKLGGGNLTNASGDLWKTLRVWSAALTAREIEVPGVCLTLLTTGTAPANSAAAFLRRDAARNVSNALVLLRASAMTSQSTANAPAYEEFLSLSEAQQEALLDSVYVVDNAPGILEVESQIEAELRYAVKPQYLAALRTRVEGWWFGRAVQALAKSGPGLVTALEADFQIEDWRTQLRDDNLPIDDDVADAEAPEGYEDRVFVTQLMLFGVRSGKIRDAILDYYRAYTQRSVWLREQLISPVELRRYERRLREEWRRHFDDMCDAVGPEGAEKAKAAAAQELYAWAEYGCEHYIRPKCSEPFVSRGTFHELADRRDVGWHPDFVELLKALLDPKEKSA
jgi:hypothetical protein